MINVHERGMFLRGEKFIAIISGGARVVGLLCGWFRGCEGGRTGVGGVKAVAVSHLQQLTSCCCAPTWPTSSSACRSRFCRHLAAR